MIECVIKWCNANTGFLSAILSAIGLLLSSIAIIVSIRTARLPFKKKLVLSSFLDVAFYKNEVTGAHGSTIVGLSVNATNIGFRNINISYLGVLVKDKTLSEEKQKIVKLKEQITGVGFLVPTEIKTELYKKEDILYALSQVSQKAKISLYARDSEGQEYFKRLGYAKHLAKKLSVN